MTLDVLEDRLEVLREIAGIEHDLTAFERQHGWSFEGDDLRRRLQKVRLNVLDQLRTPILDAGLTCSRVH
jgi:hypothetical protein